MSRPTPDADTRRTLLTGIANPAGRRDHVVELTGRVDGSRPAAVVARHLVLEWRTHDSGAEFVPASPG